jgi:ComF family protein
VGQHEAILRRAVHALKYGGRSQLALPLGTLLAERCSHEPGEAVVVPVPSRRKRIAVRGIDHARLIAESYATAAGYPIHSRTLRRVRSTKPQVGLDPGERLANVSGAFAATAAVRGRRVILIDDVLTTGATAHECALALRRAGASRVMVSTVARATVRRPNRDPSAGAVS